MCRIIFNGRELEHYESIHIILDIKSKKYEQDSDDFYGVITINHDGLRQSFLEGTIYDIEMKGIGLGAFDEDPVYVDIKDGFLHIEYKSDIWAISINRIILYSILSNGESIKRNIKSVSTLN